MGAAGQDAGAAAKGGGLSGAGLVMILVLVGAVAVGGAALAYARARAHPAGKPGLLPAATKGARAGVAPAAPTDAEIAATATDGASAPARPAPASRSFCSACGSALDPGARFCANCGGSVSGPA